jgi:putative ABC transport system substrate-binding protein
MRRREFIPLLAGTLVTLAFMAHAQSTVPVIGILHFGSPEAFSSQLEFLRQGLRENGYFEGQNVVIEYRWAEGQPGRLPELAADLVRQHVAVIAAVGGTNSALAAKAATTTIPIVFLTGGYPVALGLVSRLNRPEANITGITFVVEDLGGKDLGLLHELLPAAKGVGFLVNPDNPNASQQIENLQEAARMLGLDLQPLKATNASDLEKSFDSAERATRAILVGADPYFGTHVDQIVGLATRHRVPTVYYRREFADGGGLMSYGTSNSDAWHQVGIYAARILKGVKPGDLPVMRSTKFELVINLKTARELGVEVPAQLLARADKVIE